jgi:4a-hydroxytetrahydrobiopterin dehydratase
MTGTVPLSDERCRALRGAEHQLSGAALEALLVQVPEWRVVDGMLARDFKFADFHRTMAFVNAVAWIAHVEDHHPDLEAGYGHCRVKYSTHDVGGLSRNDFVCAAKVDRIAAEQPK